ncbi:MAG: Flp pilus assembly protein CpaB [Actinomycetota bacterium]|jgi:Flp pilus assembly protein CpaB|nr:Flp pilus assembly protein CpaB [Actinomycetota bacterium]
MAKRSNVLVVLGIAFFALGAAIVFLLVRDDTASAQAGAAGAPTQVLVATGDIAAGSTGDQVVAEGLVEAKEFAPGQIAPGALTSTALLAGQTVAADIAEGAQLTSSSLRASQVRGASVAIPEGKQGVAVQLDFVPGVGGYVGAGDRVNMYSVVRNGVPDPENPEDAPCNPRVRLFLSNVEVLDVSSEVAPRRAVADQEQERVTGSAITYLLALDPVEAERVIFMTSNESLYLALTGKDVPPTSTDAPGMCSPVADQTDSVA